jgi:hypothetical protein
MKPSQFRFVPVVVAIVAIGLTTGAAASVGRHRYPTVLPDCVGHPQVRPTLVYFACADGYFGAKHLRWTGWGSAFAAARGTAWLNDCKPSCVAGHFHSYPVVVVASGSQACAGRLAYTTLTYAFIGRSPFPANSPGTLNPTVRYRCA